MVVAQDITERKQMEAALKESEELLRTFIKHSPIYTFIKDEALRTVHASDNFRELTGVEVDQMLGREMQELFPAELAEKIVRDDLAMLATGLPFVGEEHLGCRTFHTIKYPFQLGAKKYIAGYVTDITTNKRVEEELRSLAQQFNVLTSTTLDAFWMINFAGRLLEVNARACTMLGYRREGLSGGRCFLFF